MPDYIAESRVWLAKPRAEVFEFFADPANLPLTMPRSLGLRVLTAPPALSAGAVCDLQINWLGLPLRWRCLIREFDPPVRFVTVQVQGPYARWEHRRLFLSDAGGTWMEDRVVYRLPLGAVGRVAHGLLVGRQLRALWAHRRRKASELLAPVLDAPR